VEAVRERIDVVLVGQVHAERDLADQQQLPACDRPELGTTDRRARRTSHCGSPPPTPADLNAISRL